MNFPIEILINEQASALATDAASFWELAGAYAVDDDASAECAAADLRECKAKAKVIEDTRKDLKAPFLKAGKDIDDFFRAPLDFLTKAEKTLKGALLAYQAEQDRKRREAEQSARIAAAKEAEKAEKALKEAAEEARQRGEMAAAAMIEATPVVVTAAPVAAQAAIPEGIQVKATWKAEVTDMRALLQSILDGKCPIEVLEVKQAELNKLARAMGSSLNIPGLTAREEKSIASRA